LSDNLPGMSALVQVITTFASREDALALAHAAVDARVAACAQVLGPITSVYRWEGTVHEEAEALCLFKAPSDRAGALIDFVRDHHPYDTPEITSVTSDFIDSRYLAWSVEVTGPQQGSDPSAAKQ
jgi:periplasmic divalent cation tolerance protein